MRKRLYPFGRENSLVPFVVSDGPSDLFRVVAFGNSQTPAPRNPHWLVLFLNQVAKTRAIFRAASPIRNTAANNAASGKNLAIRKPTPRNTEESMMAVRSVGIS